MRILTRFLPVLAVSALLSVPALANPLPTLPEGQTILNIAATERTEIQQDLLMATLRIEKEGGDAQTVQNEINTLMKKAVDAAKAVETVKVSTGQYYVYRNDPNPLPYKNEKTAEDLPVTWRGSQSLDLQSTSADALLKLAGALQDMGLVMGGLTYTLSPEKADAAKDALMEKALTKVTARAERAAKALGKSEMALIEINVDSADNIVQPYQMMRGMAMDGGMEKMATPTAEPGQSEITLTVSARALLKP
ncbi:MAG: SIMPL domain-containing protein [Micavibrio sp.]